MSPKLELALEKRQNEAATKRAQLIHQHEELLQQSMSTLGDTYGGFSVMETQDDDDDGLPFEFEPDEEELERREKKKAQQQQQQQHVHASTSGEISSPPSSSLSLEEPEDPRVGACEVAKQQYYQDFEYSKIVDLTGKFPLFDLSEIHQGVFLGKGSFAQVIEVKGFCLQQTQTLERKDSWNFTKSMNNRRKEMAAGGQGWMVSDGSSSHNNGGASHPLDSSRDSVTSYYIEEAQLKGGSDEDGENKNPTQEDDDDDDSMIENPAEEEEDENRMMGYHDITDDDDLDISDVEEEESKDLLEEDKEEATATTNSKDISSSRLGATNVTDMSNRSLFQNKHSTKKPRSKNNVANPESSRRFIADHCYRAKEGDSRMSVARYALKQLKRNITEDPHTLLQGIADMATETRVLK